MSEKYQQYLQALSEAPAHSLFLDLDALDRNIQWVVQNAGTKKIRIATKSIRSVEVLKRIHDSHPVFQGYMTYTLAESLWLKSLGFKDILIGYPTVDKVGLNELAKNPGEITLMVDRPEHLDLLEEIGQAFQSSFDICIDLDLSMDLPGVRFGVFRSHLQGEKELELFLNKLKTCKCLKLKAVMGYEAQIAGVMDEHAPLMRLLKSLSLPQLKTRRQNLVNIIHKMGFAPSIINGGGTGSLKHTREESVVTEVTVGSAFYAPVLFDHYQDFKLSPALFFTVPIVRKPDTDIYTTLGGGHIASGATDPIKQPQPYLPKGLSLLKHEGAGEVQTPMKYNGSMALNIGDRVIMRHAKAAEICEKFNCIHFIRSNQHLQTVNTYRGEGKCFL